MLRTRHHLRSVHPTIARAAVLGVRRQHDTRATLEAEALLRSGDSVPESLHHELLADLATMGWSSVSAAASHVLDRPRDPEWARLVELGTIEELLDSAPSLQQRFHAGHATEFSFDSGDVVVTHVSVLGDPPAVAESLFVAAIQQVVIGACVGNRPRLIVAFRGGKVLDEAGLERVRPGAPVSIESWRFTDLKQPRDARYGALVGQLVVTDPTRRWLLGLVAERLATSSRTLQRRLEHEGTTFEKVVLNARLSLAAALIERTDLSFAEIAATCGFADHAHLTNRFSRRYGGSPSMRRAERA